MEIKTGKLPKGEGRSRLNRNERSLCSSLTVPISTTLTDILNSYLNGERTLSDERLAHLVVSTPEESLSSKNGENQEYDFFLYRCALLPNLTTSSVRCELRSVCRTVPTSSVTEWRFIQQPTNSSLYSPTQISLPSLLLLLTIRIFPYFPLPSRVKWRPRKNGARLHGQLQKLISSVTKLKISFEFTFPTSLSFSRLMARVCLEQGGQSFPRASLGTRQTLVPTVSYSSTNSSKILQTCKQNSSTIASALFALSNLAYIRSTPSDQLNKRLPTNLYSALNVRGFLEKEPRGRDEYHIAIGYYKYILSLLSPSIPLSLDELTL